MRLKATKREIFGKKNKKLREEGNIPAVIYSKDEKSIPLSIDLNDFVKVYRQAGETSLIDVEIDKDSEKVIVKEVQFDPVSLNPIHVGFYKVDLKQKIRARVPVVVLGEEENELVKKGDGLALILLNEIEVEALPMNLPSEFTVDVSNLEEIGDSVIVADLNYNKGEVELIDVEEETPVVKMDWAEMEEIEEEEELTEEELIEGVEVTEETETEEGEELPEEQEKPKEKTAQENPEQEKAQNQ